MNIKKFEFTNKDIPFLKRDIIVRLSFSALCIIVFLWQFISLFASQDINNLSNVKIIATVFVLIFSLLLTLLGFLYAFKDMKIVSVIKKRGACVSSVDIIFSTKKHSFMKLYQLIAFILALASLAVLLSSLTYALLQFAYFSSISFFMPILVLVSISGFNSVFHITSEIKTVDTVKEYHSTY